MSALRLAKLRYGWAVYVGMEWLIYWKTVFECPLAIRPYIVPPQFSYL